MNTNTKTSRPSGRLRWHVALAMTVVAAVSAVAVSLSLPETPARAAVATPNDPIYPLNQWNLTKVRAPEAWAALQPTQPVVVAVVDSGVNSYFSDHPDLTNKLVDGYNAVSPGDPTWDSAAPYGRGSMVAGVIAAATNNGVGIAGLGWNQAQTVNIKVMPIKICGSIDCSYVDAAEGITEATNRGVDIIQFAPTYSTDYPALRDAVNYAVANGVLVVTGTGTNSPVGFPAAYAGVIAVSGTMQDDTRAIYTPAGSAVDISAPSENITSTTMNGEYNYFSSSYAASAHVSGALAMLIAAGVQPAAAVQALYAGAHDLGSAGWDSSFGHGRLDICAAMDAAGRQCSGTVPPVGSPTHTPTRTRTQTATATRTPTRTSTPSAGAGTATPTRTPTATQTRTATRTSTRTPTRTATRTWTPSPSPTCKGNGPKCSTPVITDSDLDGCSDVQETASNPVLGGDRNPQNLWDFFDVTGDRSVDLNDSLTILASFGEQPGSPDYVATLDRFASDPTRPYRTSAAVSSHIGIDLEDALVSLSSFGHSCTS